jgi:hypothetical protein
MILKFCHRHRTYLAVQSLSYTFSQVLPPESDPEPSSSNGPVPGQTNTVTQSQDTVLNLFRDPAGTMRVETVTAEIKCQRFCRCKCHFRSTISTPLWLQRAVGTLFYSYSGIPLFNFRACSDQACRKRQDSSFQFTYHFPGWLVSRVLILSATIRDVTTHGATLCIRLPRMIPGTNVSWNMAREGALSPLKHLFKQGLASPFDINQEGRSFLMVRMLLMTTIEY